MNAVDGFFGKLARRRLWRGVYDSLERSRGLDSGLHRAEQREGGEAVQMDGQPGAAHRRLPKGVSDDSDKPLGPVYARILLGSMLK